MAEPSAEEVKKRKKWSGIHWRQITKAAVAALFIFALGVNVGNGRLQVGRLAPSSGNEKLPANLNYHEVEQVYDTLKDSFDGSLTVEQLLDGLKDGLAQATGDEYTEYLNEEEASEFDDQLSGTFSGIGAELGKRNDAITVIAPISGFPAEKAGLRAGDIIIEIDGEAAYDLTVSEAVTKIRGPEGTKVKLGIVRDGQEMEFEITRDQITIASVTTEMLDGNIGYLKISRFGEDTTSLSRKATAEFKQAGVKGVILDLRSNPGGLLDVSVDLASIWLPKDALVVQEKRGDKVVEDFKASGKSILEGMPTVVLIDEGSASASEILAGALRDNKAAQLLGMKTFGKGSVQQLEDLVGGGVLKVTIARWYTPSGKNIDKEGLSPDIEVERTDEDYTSGKDPQRDRAQELLR